MKICLVGGIFDREAAFRSRHAITPETVLLDGFRKSDVCVDAMGHAQFQPSDEYDIIHVHHIGQAALKMASGSSRARFVFTGHNGLIVTGYERSMLRRRAFHYVVGKADAVVALSQAEAGYFATVGAGQKVHVIPNGIPADVFRGSRESYNGKQEDTAKSRFNILYVGQLIDWKGVHFLLQAVQQLRRKCNVRLRLVYHNGHLENLYRRMVVDLGIAENVEFVGILGPPELAEEYRQADLLVLPSFADCLPSVVTEALLCGTPVVAGAVCGVPEQVGKYGLVVPPGDVPALTAALASMVDELPRFQSMAPEMRAYAESKFNPEAMVQAHLRLYRDLIEGETKPSRKRGSVFDPLVRLAIKVYWFRSRKPGSPKNMSERVPA